jgi:chromosome partitioning protein
MRANRAPTGIVISVLNMKGGVGKTTISAHVMRVLYHMRSKKVLLVDLDPQFNLSQCLLTRANYDKLKKEGKTVFMAMEPLPNIGIFDVATTMNPPPQPSTIAYRLRQFRDLSAYLDILLGDFDRVKYSLIDDRLKLDKAQQRFLHFISLARTEYDVVVIDCNPSSSFITLCALRACSKLLVPVRPDLYSVLGLELVSDFLDRIPTINPKPEIAILLNGIPTHGYDRRTEAELRGHNTFGPLVLTNRLRQSQLLGASSGYTGFATDKPVPYRNLLRTEIGAIVAELAQRWGL